MGGWVKARKKKQKIRRQSEKIGGRAASVPIGRERCLAARAIRAGRGRGFKGEGIAPPVAPRAASSVAWCVPRKSRLRFSRSIGRRFPFVCGSSCYQYRPPNRKLQIFEWGWMRAPTRRGAQKAQIFRQKIVRGDPIPRQLLADQKAVRRGKAAAPQNGAPIFPMNRRKAAARRDFSEPRAAIIH